MKYFFFNKYIYTAIVLCLIFYSQYSQFILPWLKLLYLNSILFACIIVFTLFNLILQFNNYSFILSSILNYSLHIYVVYFIFLLLYNFIPLIILFISCSKTFFLYHFRSANGIAFDIDSNTTAGTSHYGNKQQNKTKPK